MKNKTLFVKKGTKEYYQDRLRVAEIRIANLVERIKRFSNIKKVRCETCKKLVGLRRDGSYDLEEGTIQKGQGKKKPLLSYCSRKCEIKLKEEKDK